MRKRNKILATALCCVATVGTAVGLETVGDFSISSGGRSVEAFENGGESDGDKKQEGRDAALHDEEFAAANAANATTAQRGYKAFLVGADDYDAVAPLACVKKDVEELAARLIEIGFDKKNVVVLKTGGDGADLPIKANIEKRFEEFVESLKPGDFALVFLSGHGLQTGGDAFFVPVDWQPSDALLSKAISVERMLKRLEASQAKFRWMIVDACRNVPRNWEKALLATRELSSAKGLTAAIEVPDSTALLQSCQPGKVSYEGGEGVENGYFTLSLLEALDKNGSKADNDNDGVLMFTELISYVTKRTDDLAKKYGGESQKPTFSGSMTDFAVLNTLIEGIPAPRWQEANDRYKRAAELENEGNYEDALVEIREARKINSGNKDYLALEKRVANVIKLKQQLEAAARQAKEEPEAEEQRRAAEETTRQPQAAARRAKEEPESAASQSSNAGSPSGRISASTPSVAANVPSAATASDPSAANAATASDPSAAVAWTEKYAAGTQKSLEIQGASYNFRYCPAGTFTMGSPATEAGRCSDEREHSVTLTRGFWALETEVTQALWESVTGKNPSGYKGPKKPVENVSWEDCQAFVETLNVSGCAPAGMKFRLPTEAEWEYACRAGTSGAYAGASLDSLGWFQKNAGVGLREVGTKDANPWGLRDIHGNVQEWCDDWYGDYADSATSQEDPTGPLSGERRVMRGGGWFNDSASCRSAFRGGGLPTIKFSGLGVRLVLSCER